MSGLVKRGYGRGEANCEQGFAAHQIGRYEVARGFQRGIWGQNGALKVRVWGLK
jgi:hypothetical protein